MLAWWGGAAIVDAVIGNMGDGNKLIGDASAGDLVVSLARDGDRPDDWRLKDDFWGVGRLSAVNASSVEVSLVMMPELRENVMPNFFRRSGSSEGNSFPE